MCHKVYTVTLCHKVYTVTLCHKVYTVTLCHKVYTVTRDHWARMDGEIVNRIQSTLLHVSSFLSHYSVVHPSTISCISLLVSLGDIYVNTRIESVLKNTIQSLNTESRFNHQSRKWCQHWSRKVKVGLLTPALRTFLAVWSWVSILWLGKSRAAARQP